MTQVIRKLLSVAAVVSMLHLSSITSVLAQDDGGDLAAKTQNPISSMISVPFEFTFDNGASNGEANILNIQPVVPISLGDWNIINRAIIPLIDAPGGVPLQGIPNPIPGPREFGLGDINYSMFLSPNDSGAVTWGVGPTINLPTATDSQLGSGKWSAGPTAVILTQPKPWTIGALVSQKWSFAGDSNRGEVSQFALQPFLNYNLDEGWYLFSSPTLVANWNSAQQWTIPVGAGEGRIFTMGAQPVNVRLGGEYNVVRPNNAPEWAVKFTFQLLFPK